MSPTEVISKLHQTALNSIPPHRGRAAAYVQYRRRSNGHIHYEVYVRNNASVDVRLDDERDSVEKGDILRQQLIFKAKQGGSFCVSERKWLVIRHVNPVQCEGRQFTEIISDIQSRLMDLCNAFEPILAGIKEEDSEYSSTTHTGFTVPIDGKRKRRDGEGFDVDICKEIIIALQREGAELIGDGVRRPSGKRRKAALCLCQIGDVLFSLGFKVNQIEMKLCCSISERVERFRALYDGQNGDIKVKLNSEITSYGRINPSWVKEVKDKYQFCLNKLTAGDTPFLYKKFDWRRKQFDPPEKCFEIINQLETSLLFAMSHGAHELFHTNVWAWLIKCHPEFARVFFDDIAVDTIVDVRREQGNRDLTIWVEINGERKAYVVENKFKSSASEEQLVKYKNALQEHFAGGLLVTLDTLPEWFVLPDGWRNKQQSDIVKAVTNLLRTNYYDATDVELRLLVTYADVTSRMSELFNSYRKALGEKWALALSHNEWDEVRRGDLESVRLADILKKMNASDFKTRLEREDAWKRLRLRVEKVAGSFDLVVTTDFLHKLPIVNCNIAYGDSSDDKAFVGVILQGNSFGRNVCTFNERWTKNDGAQRIYEFFRRNSWFDDLSFLRQGLSLKRRATKQYKQYATTDYLFVYQDIGIESDTFEYLTQLVIKNMEKAVILLEQGQLNSFFGVNDNI